MKSHNILLVIALIMVFTAAYFAREYADNKLRKDCVISGEQMVHLRDSILMSEMETGAHNSFREPFVDSILDAEAARRADSMYLRRLSQYD